MKFLVGTRRLHWKGFDPRIYFKWCDSKLAKLNDIEIPRIINIQRIARGWYARKVVVRAATAGNYWEKEPLWVRKKDRQGKNILFRSRITLELYHLIGRTAT